MKSLFKLYGNPPPPTFHLIKAQATLYLTWLERMEVCVVWIDKLVWPEHRSILVLIQFKLTSVDNYFKKLLFF